MRKIKMFWDNLDWIAKMELKDIALTLCLLIVSSVIFTFDSTDCLILGGCFLGICIYRIIVHFRMKRFYKLFKNED